MTFPLDPERRKIQLGTGPASYTDEGPPDAPTVVTVHGLPGSARDFRWLAPHLVDDVRVVRLELPGFGETPWSTWSEVPPVGRARFVQQMVDALKLDRPVLLGHSMGGVVSTATAYAQPGSFRGLALVCSPGLRQHSMIRRLPFSTFSRILASRPVGPALKPLVRRFFEMGGFKRYPDHELYTTIHLVAQASIPEHAERVRNLTLPTLVCWCDDDPFIEGKISRQLAETCPDGPRLGFPEGGHNPQKSHAAELGQALKDWLQKLD